MKRLILWLVIVIMSVSIITVFSLAGCKKAEEAVPAEEEASEEAVEEATSAVEERPYEGVILHYIATNDRPQYALKEILPEFEEATGIKVEMELLGIADEQMKTRMEASKGSDEYDIWVIPTFDNIVYVSNGWIQNLDEMGEITGKKLNQDNWMPGVLEKAGLHTDGTLYSVPIQFAYGDPVMYRKDMLENPDEQAAFKEKYGYKLTPPETWDEFRDIAEFFTRDTDGDGEIDFWGASLPLADGGPQYNTWLPMYYTSGGLDKGEELYCYLLSKDFEPVFNGPEGVRSIEFMRDLYQDGLLSPGALTTSWSACSEALMAKKCFMTYMWGETMEPAFDPEISEVSDLVWWTAPPYWEEPRMQMGAWMMTINSESKNKEAAWEFILWATSHESEAKQIKTGLGPKIPLRTENMSNEELSKPWYPVVFDMLESREVLGELYFAQTDIVMLALGPYLQKIVVGEMSAQEGLDAAAEEIVNGLTEAGVYE